MAAVNPHRTIARYVLFGAIWNFIQASVLFINPGIINVRLLILSSLGVGIFQLFVAWCYFDPGGHMLNHGGASRYKREFGKEIKRATNGVFKGRK